MPKSGINGAVPLMILIFIIATAACSSGPKVKLDPESKNFYETAGLIMTKQEKTIFDHLPDQSSRREFIADFWKKRDPDPSTDDNEFQEEFYGRIDYANAHFNQGTPGWKTDRGRIFIYFGQPDRIERRPMLNNVNIKGLQIWIYYRYDFAIEFIDRIGDGSYSFDPYSGIMGSFFDALEMAQMGLDYTNQRFGIRFVDFTLQYIEQTNSVRVTVPVKKLGFTEKDGLLEADFEFTFYVYSGGNVSGKQTFEEQRTVEIKEEELVRTKDLNFDFSFDLPPGKYYFDTVIVVKPDLAKTRKIFEIKVKS